MKKIGPNGKNKTDPILWLDALYLYSRRHWQNTDTKDYLDCISNALVDKLHLLVSKPIIKVHRTITFTKNTSVLHAYCKVSNIFSCSTLIVEDILRPGDFTHYLTQTQRGNYWLVTTH